MNHKILRLPNVKERVGLSRSSIYAHIAEGNFPQPIKLGGQRAVGWLENEIEEWLTKQVERSRIKSKDSTGI
jgi:prophage regulatory protein